MTKIVIKTTKLSNNQPEVTTSHAFETAIRKAQKDVERENITPPYLQWRQKKPPKSY
jgi:hypothetical protein